MENNFLSCDWGTSSFRLRLVSANALQVMATFASQEGIALVYDRWKASCRMENERQAYYLTILQAQLNAAEQQWKINTAGLPVIVSGMASSSIGMLELPYAELPFSLKGAGIQYRQIKNTDTFPHPLLLISGARTQTDAMRGEETQLLGCADLAINGKQVFVCTGTHSKHISVQNGHVVGSATYMTGEFFALLSTKSILADSIERNQEDNTETRLAYNQGIEDSRQQNLLHHSFMVRTHQLFERFSRAANYWYLSGLLIGTELAQLPVDAQEIIIIGEAIIAADYRLAATQLGVGIPITLVDATKAVIAGQWTIAQLVNQNNPDQS